MFAPTKVRKNTNCPSPSRANRNGDGGDSNSCVSHLKDYSMLSRAWRRALNLMSRDERTTQARRCRRRPAGAARLFLEALEDRTLPAVSLTAASTDALVVDMDGD